MFEEKKEDHDGTKEQHRTSLCMKRIAVNCITQSKQMKQIAVKQIATYKPSTNERLKMEWKIGKFRHYTNHQMKVNQNTIDINH